MHAASSVRCELLRLGGAARRRRWIMRTRSVPSKSPNRQSTCHPSHTPHQPQSGPFAEPSWSHPRGARRERGPAARNCRRQVGEGERVRPAPQDTSEPHVASPSRWPERIRRSGAGSWFAPGRLPLRPLPRPPAGPMPVVPRRSTRPSRPPAAGGQGRQGAQTFQLRTRGLNWDNMVPNPAAHGGVDCRGHRPQGNLSVQPRRSFAGPSRCGWPTCPWARGAPYCSIPVKERSCS